MGGVPLPLLVLLLRLQRASSAQNQGALLCARLAGPVGQETACACLGRDGRGGACCLSCQSSQVVAGLCWTGEGGCTGQCRVKAAPEPGLLLN